MKFESLDHFAIEKIELQYNKISFLVIQTVEKLIKNLSQFKEQAKLHQNMFQMQAGRSQQQGSSLTAQITAHTLGNISNKGYQPNKVIIEQTEESSETSESSHMNSFDAKTLPELFAEFMGQECRKRTKRQESRNKSETGRWKRKNCNTPDSFNSHSTRRRTENHLSAEQYFSRWPGTQRSSQKRISDMVDGNAETESVTP